MSVLFVRVNIYMSDPMKQWYNFNFVYILHRPFLWGCLFNRFLLPAVHMWMAYDDIMFIWHISRMCTQYCLIFILVGNIHLLLLESILFCFHSSSSLYRGCGKVVVLCLHYRRRLYWYLCAIVHIMHDCYYLMMSIQNKLKL